MSDTETLRRAAALMRDRAEAATPGPWWAAVGQGPKRRKQQIALVGRADMRGQGEAGCIAVLAGVDQPRADDAEHIAAWHPGVALAVAAWLEGVAERHYEDGVEELLLHPEEPCSVCAEQGGHEMPVCGGCYPTWDAEHARAVWPCVEFLDALAVARAYLGEEAAWTG